jgi:hypothetical protein
MIYDRRAMPLIKQLKRVESAAQKIVERLNSGDPEALTLDRRTQCAQAPLGRDPRPAGAFPSRQTGSGIFSSEHQRATHAAAACWINEGLSASKQTF